MVKVVKVDKRVRIIIDEDLRWELKALAARQKTSMQSLVNKAIKKYLAEVK